MGNRGERVELKDRITCLALVQEAVDSGATRAASCEVLELSVRTHERWRLNEGQADLRAGPISVSPHALTEGEKNKMIEVANSEFYRDLGPWKIVAKLADSQSYLASESSFYRVLKKANLLKHRNKNKIRTHKKQKDLIERICS